MKKITRIKIQIIFLVLGLSCGAFAQNELQIVVNFSPPYPREFSAYFNQPQNYSVTVINTTSTEQSFYLLGELHGLSNGVLVKVADTYKPLEALIIPPHGMMTVNGRQLADLYMDLSENDLIIRGIPNQQLNINGMLPEGEYEWCINAYDYKSSGVRPLSTGCSPPFSIYYGDQLIIISPFEEQVIQSDVFTILWNPTINDLSKREQLEYEVKMIDITAYPNMALDLLFLDGTAQPVLDVLALDEFYVYNQDGSAMELIEGHQYGIRIRAIDPFNEVQFANNGYSEIRIFYFGFNPNDVSEEDDQETDCYGNCHYTANINTNDSGSPGALDSMEIGFFTMKSIQIQSNNNGVLTGTGTIQVPWLADQKVSVEFNNIKVNASGRIYQGIVKTSKVNGLPYNLDDVYTAMFVNQSACPDATLAALSQDLLFIRNLVSLVADQETGVPIGINQMIGGRQFTLGILSMEFTPDRAEIGMISLVDFRSLAADLWISMGAEDVCMTPDGIGGEFMLYQPFEERKIGLGGMDVVTYGGLGTEEQIAAGYCFIEVNCDGIKRVGLRGEVSFSRNTIVPDDNGDVGVGKVKGYFDFYMDRLGQGQSQYEYEGNAQVQGTQLMLGFNMDPFQITGLEGWSFITGPGSLDMSDLENPDSLYFPVEYDFSLLGDSSMALLWRGFHFATAQIKAPGQFSSGNRAGAFFNNVLLEPDLTMEAGILNLLQVGEGNMEGWGFSIDSFKLKIVQNTFIEGGLYGQINPPVTGENDYFNYKAILDKNENDDYRIYAIALPDTLISVPISLAKAVLCPNSYVSFTTEPGNAEVSTFLKGQMVIDVNENLPPELNDLGVIPDLEIRLADFQLNYSSNQGFITPDMVSDGTGSSFGFGIQLHDATCGDLYSGKPFEFDGFDGYNYNEEDISNMLTSSFPSDNPSMQENIDAFPVQIGNYNINFSNNSVNLGLDMDISLNASPIAISLGTSLNINSVLDVDGNGLKHFVPDGIGLECARLGGSDPGSNIAIEPFAASGELCFVEHDDGSNGFTGDIELGLGVFTMNLIAGFGTYGKPDDGVYGTSDYYGWWYFDGMARVFPGVLIPPVIWFNGFGGGIYWNVTAPGVSMSMDEIQNLSGPTQPNMTTDPQPSFGQRTLAFRTSWSVVSEQVMMIDPYIAGTWQEPYGLQSLSVGGDFWMIALSYASRHDARIYGHSTNTLTFMDQGGAPVKVALTGTNEIYANIIDNMLYGAGQNNKLINTAFAMGHEDFFPGESSNSDADDIFWFFNAGNPYQSSMGGVVYDIPGFNLSQSETNNNQLGIDASFTAQLYTMTGQNIPNYLPDPPGEVANLFGLKNSDEGSFDGGSREDDRNAFQATSGQGIVLGSHVTAEAEIRAIFYASFKVFAGLDIMLLHLDGTSCYTSDGIVNNPGVLGWYGTGRAYSGIEGAVGVKGKIFGKEIDIKVMELVAAMMLEAGGPNPMWLDGRAVLTYNLLGGTIKGSTRMMISVGDKCVPPQTSPFDFPIIAEYYPNEQEHRKINPFVSPTVSFTVPINEIIAIPDVNGVTQMIKPMLEINKFTITQDCNNCTTSERDTRYDLIAEDGRTATYNPANPLCGMNSDTTKKKYRMQVTVYAEEFNYSTSQWERVELNGVDWEEEIDLNFRTDKLPYPIPEELIGKTKPLSGQKFYFNGETAGKNYVHLRDDIQGTYYYSSDDQGVEYEYFAVIKDKSGVEIERKPITYNQNTKKLKWDKPDYNLNKEFIIQIVRKPVNNTPGGMNIPYDRKILIQTDLLAAHNSDDLSFNYTVEPELPDLSPENTVAADEVLLHSFSFETSAFETLADKMANAEVTVEEKNGYLRVNITGIEGFDEFDINGWVDDAVYSSPPRVNISDPFYSPFHNNESKPKLGGFADMYLSNYAGVWTGVQSIGETNINPVDLNGNPPQTGGMDNYNNLNLILINDYTNGGIIKVNFPGDLPHTNYEWENADGLKASLNEHVIQNTIIQADEEDDYFNPFLTGYNDYDSYRYYAYLPEGNGPSAPNPNYTLLTELNPLMNNHDYAAGHQVNGSSGNHSLSLKYYVIEDVLADAQAYLDFGEEWIDITETGNYGDGTTLEYVQTYEEYEVEQLLMNLIGIKSTILNSDMINGSNSGFSNEIRFRANKSFEAGNRVRGTQATIQFPSNARFEELETPITH